MPAINPAARFRAGASPCRCLAVALVSLALPTACTADTSTAPKPPSTAPSTAPATAPATQPITLDTTTMTLKGKVFTMEVAQNDAQTARGLMYRDSLPPDHGMLFVMPRADIWSFWMKNTRIPLDIIFVDRTGKVVLIDNRTPMDETGHGPDTPVQYVIELNLGLAQKIGLRKGDTVEIPAKYVKN
jgi:uncharacterized protein